LTRLISEISLHFEAVVGPPPSRSSSSAARVGGSGGAPSVFDNIVGLASNQSEPPLETGNGSAKGISSRKISMYRNGFTVDDGELRDLTTPENLAFIASSSIEGTEAALISLIIGLTSIAGSSVD